MDTSRKTLKDTNRCNYCINYEPFKNNGKTYCRGKCRVTGSYKQRTDYCKKHFIKGVQLGLFDKFK